MAKKSHKNTGRYNKKNKAPDNSLQGNENSKHNAVSSRPYLFFAFFSFYIILLPLIHNTNTLDQVMMPRLFAVNLFILIFSVFVFYSAKLFYESGAIIRQHLFPAIGLWFFISLISLLLSTNSIEGIYDIIKIFNLLAVLFIASILLLKTENWENKVILLFSVAAIIMSFVGFWQYYDRVYLSSSAVIEDDPYLRPVIYLVDGLMAHKNLFSLALFMCMPFALTGVFTKTGKIKYLSILSVAITLILIVILQTRAVWLGTIAATALVLLVLLLFGKQFKLHRSIKLTLLAGAISGVIGIAGLFYLSYSGSQNPYVQQFRSIVDPEGKQNVHRINIWKTTISMIEEKPVTGFGPGNWKLHAGYYFDGRFFDENQLNWMRPHNDFLWIFAEKGIIGFILYLLIFGLCYMYLFKVIMSNAGMKQKLMALFLIFGFTGYLVSSFFDFPYERVYHQMTLAVMMACSLVLYYQRKTKEQKAHKISRFIPMGLIILGAGFGTIYGNKAVKQEKELKIAREQIRRQNWQRALIHSEKAINPLRNLDPQANPITSYIGLAYVNMGNMEKGMEYYLDAYNLHPGSINVLNNLGAALYRNEEFEKARYYLEKSVFIFPSSDGVTNLSAVYFDLGMYNEAVDIIMQIPQEHRTFNMTNNLLSTLFKLEKYEEVEKIIKSIPIEERADKINPTIINNLFLYHYHNNADYAKAIEVTKLWPVEAMDENMINNLWRAYLYTRDFNDAFKIITGIPEEERMIKAEAFINSLFAVYVNRENYDRAYELILLVPEEDRTDSMSHNLRVIDQIRDGM